MPARSGWRYGPEVFCSGLMGKSAEAGLSSIRRPHLKAYAWLIECQIDALLPADMDFEC